uniref:Uncharacterized protein n=1 Tax=Oryza meridionalis TaxID=40149 RepID=A0A0E0DX93_9ORYZ
MRASLSGPDWSSAHRSVQTLTLKSSPSEWAQLNGPGPPMRPQVSNANPRLLTLLERATPPPESPARRTSRLGVAVAVAVAPPAGRRR